MGTYSMALHYYSDPTPPQPLQPIAAQLSMKSTLAPAEDLTAAPAVPAVNNKQNSPVRYRFGRNVRLAGYSILDIGHSNVQCRISNIQLTSRSSYRCTLHINFDIRWIAKLDHWLLHVNNLLYLHFDLCILTFWGRALFSYEKTQILSYTYLYPWLGNTKKEVYLSVQV